VATVVLVLIALDLIGTFIFAAAFSGRSRQDSSWYSSYLPDLSTVWQVYNRYTPLGG